MPDVGVYSVDNPIVVHFKKKGYLPLRGLPVDDYHAWRDEIRDVLKKRYQQLGDFRVIGVKNATKSLGREVLLHHLPTNQLARSFLDEPMNHLIGDDALDFDSKRKWPSRDLKGLLAKLAAQTSPTASGSAEDPVAAATEKLKTGNAKVDSAVRWLMGKSRRAEVKGKGVIYTFKGKLPARMVKVFSDSIYHPTRPEDASATNVLKDYSTTSQREYLWTGAEGEFSFIHGAYVQGSTSVTFEGRIYAEELKKKSGKTESVGLFEARLLLKRLMWQVH